MLKRHKKTKKHEFLMNMLNNKSKNEITKYYIIIYNDIGKQYHTNHRVLKDIEGK